MIPVKLAIRRHIALFLVGITLLFSARPAKADSIENSVISAAVGVIAGTVIVVVAVVYFVRKTPSITGCASSTPDGLTLLNEGDRQTYVLTGDTSTIKSGDRIKVSGKKGKKNLPANRPFVVEKPAKDFGSCKVPATS
jgi:hypothetical protein